MGHSTVEESKEKLTARTAGFTLIELLVVVAVVGILAAIAVPQFSAYRERGFDARAQSDLRNAALAQEALFATDERYVSCLDAACERGLPGFRLSSGVTIRMTAAAGSFTATSKHAAGSETFAYDSAKGGVAP